MNDFVAVNNALQVLGLDNGSVSSAVRDALLGALRALPPTTLSENGAPAISLGGMITSSKTEDELWGCLLALNTLAVRSSSQASVLLVAFQPVRAKLHDPLARQDILRLIAYIRDISDGKGEREITYFLLNEIVADGYAADVKRLLKLFPTVGYGYWGDLVNFYSRVSSSDFKLWILKTLMHQARQDERLLIQAEKLSTTKPNISLLGKWLPSEKGQNDFVANDLAMLMYPGKGGKHALVRYRHLCSKLRKHLQVVERFMSANQWGSIDPSATPSKAMKKYRKVFSNAKGLPDPGRVLLAEKLMQLISGKMPGKTIKTKGLQFYELIKVYIDGGSLDDVIEAQAKTIINDMQVLVRNGNFPISVALCDVSGSMSGIPMIVSIALGILLANIMPAPWAGRVITFESTPQWVTISGFSSIWEQVRVLQGAPWGGSTNFTAAVNLILQEALMNKTVAMPAFLFCFTDMQFDAASEDKHFVIDVLKANFRRHELVMPKLVLWNLRASGTCSFASDKDTLGVGMLSGFSQSAFKAFMTGCDFDKMTPMSLLKEALHSPRYDAAAGCCVETTV